jgi:ATP-binding protein involved in chromosome partitioning
MVNKIINTIAVCSGKGGVGKSTVTTNLTVALAQQGYKVGLLDADIYGYSIPRMMGLKSATPQVTGEKLMPVAKEGIQVISMGFFIPADQAVLWRGPLLHKAVTQFIDDVIWGELDFLLVDLPPGTGDICISIANKLPEAKLLAVTTPQISAYEVAARVGVLARETKMEIIGVVENMSYYELPDGTRDHIFGSGGGKVLARRLNTELLAEIPLSSDLRAASDSGKPLAAVAEEIFLRLAQSVADKCSAGHRTTHSHK